MSSETIQILLVEGSTGLIRKTLESAFNHAQVTVAHSLAEARTCLSKSFPDLAIIDLLLPDGKGLELLPAFPQETTFPVVITADQEDVQAAVEVMKAGALDCIVKSPATLADLPCIVEKTLHEWTRIVERRRAEEKLRLFFESAASGLAVVSPEGKILKVNPTFCRLSGYSEAEVLQKNVLEVTHPDDRDETRRLYDEIRSGQRKVIDYEKRYLCKDGSVIWGRATVAGVFGPNNDLLYYAANVQDISERKQAAHLLRESQQMLKLVLDYIPQHVFWKDRNSVYLGCNQNFARVAGLKTPEEIVGLSDYDLPWKKEESDFFRQCDKRTMETDTPEFHIIEEQLQADGKQAWVDTNKVPLHDAEGNVVGILGTFEDITERMQAEEALRDSEARFRSLFESAATGMFTISPMGRILRGNKAFCDFLGYSKNELLDLTVDDITHPTDKKRTADNYRSLIGGQCQTIDYEKCYVRKDGSTIWGRASVSSVLGDDSTPQYYVGLVQNITERKQAEKELRESEERFRAIFEQAAVGVAQVTPDGGLRRVNKKFCDIVGYSREEIQKLTFQDITHPDDLDADLAYVEQMLAGEIQTYSMEKRYIRKDGSLIWVNLTVGLRRDPEGQPNYFVSVVEDISQRKQAEKALRKSEANIKAIFNNVEAGIDVLDSEGRFVDVNDRLTEMLGYTKDELIGRSPVDFTHPEDRQKSQTILKKILKGQLDACSFEKRYVRKDGTVFWGDLAFTKVLDEKGEVEADIGIVFDITERKAMEEKLKAANRELEAFVYTLSHDLRTPLVPIIGYAEFLKERCKDHLDEQSLDCLKEIETAGERMLALMEDLLSLAKVGYVERPAEPIDTNEVLRKVLVDLGSRIASKNVDVHVDPLPSLHVPETLLSQILDNLISNALRYGTERGDGIEVGGERRGGRALFFARDHGPGIPKDEQGRVFDVFYRGKAGRNIKGTGVGLATVQKIARLYGGRAWVEETPGGGSTFWVEMVDV